ncbi:MAG: hypothetical protein ABR947_09865 [Solirubrobacteraceae bacterium]|jgi:hypothetical protein
MGDGQDRSQFEQDASAQAEVVDGVVVVSSVRTIERTRESPPPFVQVAAVAATGFMAGAATAAVFGRRLSRNQARRAALAPAAEPRPLAPARSGSVEVLASQRFIVDVYTLARR